MIELVTAAQPAGRDVADGGLEADNPARGGRDADRASSVGADAGERHAGGDADRGPAARATRRPCHIVWVSCRSEGRILVGDAEGELVQVGLADKHGARTPQVCDNVCVLGSDMTLAHARRGGGRRAAHVDQVFDGDRHAVEGAASSPAASSRSASSALVRASSAITHVNAFRRRLSSPMRCRQCSVTCRDESSPARNERPNASIVSVSRFVAIWTIVEIGAAEDAQGIREAIEQRFQLWQPSPFGIGERQLQPVIDSHMTPALQGRDCDLVDALNYQSASFKHLELLLCVECKC